jgi:hypothetical protein
VAIKVEPVTHRDIGSPLRQESRIYKALMGGPGVPWIMWSGKQGDYNVIGMSLLRAGMEERGHLFLFCSIIVIDRLGKDLDKLFKMCNRHFTLKTVLMLTDQLVCPWPHLRFTWYSYPPPLLFPFPPCRSLVSNTSSPEDSPTATSSPPTLSWARALPRAS